MRYLSASLVLVGLIGGCECGNPAPPSTTPATTVAELPTPVPSTAPPTTAPTTAPTTRPAPPPSDTQQAQRAYLDAVHAFDTRDADAYFAAFEPTLSCFYGHADVPLDRVRHERWHDDGTNGLLLSVELSVLSHAGDEVVLLDRGFFRDGRGGDALFRQVMHQKIIVMHRSEGVWRIAAETPAASRACLGDRVPADVAPSATFEACRTEHAACLVRCSDARTASHCSMDDGSCAACVGACQDAALRCIGVHVSGGDVLEQVEPSGPVSVATEADVRRFVTLSLADELGEVAVADQPWFAGAHLALGAPFFHVTAEYDGYPICTASLLRPVDAWPDLEHALLRDVHCATDAAGALARCVVTIEASIDGNARSVDLTLAFDGPHLRAVHRDEPRAAGPAPAGLLDRYASSHPPEWDATCPVGLIALAEDRVGEDYFEVSDGTDEEMTTMTVQRLCGEPASRAVRALGDGWACDDAGCQSEWGCGNFCDEIVLDTQHRVLAHVAGMSGSVAFSSALATVARRSIACGHTGAMPIPDDM